MNVYLEHVEHVQFQPQLLVGAGVGSCTSNRHCSASGATPGQAASAYAKRSSLQRFDSASSVGSFGAPKISWWKDRWAPDVDIDMCGRQSSRGPQISRLFDSAFLTVNHPCHIIAVCYSLHTGPMCKTNTCSYIYHVMWLISVPAVTSTARCDCANSAASACTSASADVCIA